jgi:hypothetical protein
LRAKVPVFVNLAFNVNIEFLSLGGMIMRSRTLSTLRRVLSTIDASDHLHHMALRMDPTEGVDWEAWEEVYSVLAEPRFQFLRVLCINIGPSTILQNSDVVLKATLNMVAAHPSLATRHVRVSYDSLRYECIFCRDSPWN